MINIAHSELTNCYYVMKDGKKIADVTEQIQTIVDAEHKAMCKTCIHKVNADDIKAIRNSAIDECIAKINSDHSHSAYHPDVYEAILLLEQLKEDQ